MTTIWLYVLSGEELGRVETFQTSELTIGRGDDVQMKLQSSTISRHHARLKVVSGGQLWVQDLKSTSGTFLAGKRIHQAEIPTGAVLRIANIELRVRVEYEEEAEESGMDLELEGEWEEGVTPKAPAPVQQAPVQQAPAPQAAKPSAKDQRRAQQLADMGVAPKDASNTAGRKRALQYSQHNTNYGIGGGDMSQRAPWQKTLAVLFGIAMLAGLAYGAYYLTQGARQTRVDTLDVGSLSARTSGEFV